MMTNLSPVEKGLFKEWTPRTYPAWCSIQKGRYKTLFHSRVALMAGPIDEAKEDGLPQLAPIIAFFGERPQVIRKIVGKAIWRQFHASTEFVNVRRVAIKMFAPFLSWESICEIKDGNIHRVMRDVHRGASWDLVHYVGCKAEFKPPNDYEFVSMLYRDTQRNGLDINPDWSVNRLRKEHDKFAAKVSAQRHSTVQWAEPEEYEVDGFVFTRLVSDAEIAREGMEMRHCIATHYMGAARHLKIQVYKVTGAERATLAFESVRENSGIPATYFELKRHCNARATVRCTAAAKQLASQLGGLRP